MNYDPAETARLLALELPIGPYTQQRLQEQLRAAAGRIERLERALEQSAQIAEQHPYYHGTHYHGAGMQIAAKIRALAGEAGSE